MRRVGNEGSWRVLRFSGFWRFCSFWLPIGSLGFPGLGLQGVKDEGCTWEFPKFKES